MPKKLLWDISRIMLPTIRPPTIKIILPVYAKFQALTSYFINSRTPSHTDQPRIQRAGTGGNESWTPAAAKSSSTRCPSASRSSWTTRNRKTTSCLNNCTSRWINRCSSTPINSRGVSQPRETTRVRKIWIRCEATHTQHRFITFHRVAGKAARSKMWAYRLKTSSGTSSQANLAWKRQPWIFNNFKRSKMIMGWSSCSRSLCKLESSCQGIQGLDLRIAPWCNRHRT